MAAAVVNNLVLEAGVNSLSASWKKSTLPVESDSTSMPQNPRARSADSRIAPTRFSSGLRAAACSCVNSNRHSAICGKRRVRRIVNELYIGDRSALLYVCAGRAPSPAAFEVDFELENQA